MNKADQQALDELNAYLASRTEESNRVSDKHYISAYNRINDPKLREQHKEACATKRNNSYQAEANSRKEVKEKISRALAGRVKSAEHNEKVAASNRARATDPEQHARLMAGLAKRDRQFHAGPYGIHPSLNAAARYAAEQGLSNAVKKFEKWKKTDPTNYYFLEKQ